MEIQISVSDCWFYLLFCLLIPQVDAVIPCFKCEDMSQPVLCLKLTTCGIHEKCVVEQYVATNGAILYSSGCKAIEQCYSPQVGRRRRSQSGDILTCIECCDSPYCNNKGCGNQDPSADFLYCYECTGIQKPEDCRSVTVCNKDQYCFIEANQLFHSQVYHMSCKDKPTCEVISHISSILSVCPAECCSVSFCNNKCDNSVTPQPGSMATTTLSPSLVSTNTAMIPVTHHDKNLECKAHAYQGYIYNATSDLCIKFQPSKNATQIQAEAACQHDGGHLVMLDSPIKMDAVLARIQAYADHGSFTNFWIGAKSTTNNTTYMNFNWPDGRHVTYNDWGSQYCVIMNHADNYYWHDRSCGMKAATGFICEFQATSPDELRNKCIQHAFSDGYIYDKGSSICFHVYNTSQQLSQPEAERKCSSLGATLVALDSQEKMDLLLYSIFSGKVNMSDFWIGAISLNNSDFYWPNKHVMQYQYWGVEGNSPQPDNLYHGCVRLDHLASYKWRRSSCLVPLRGYICELTNVAFSEKEKRCQALNVSGYKWDPVSHMCYSLRAMASRVTQATASSYCRNDGGQLITIDSTAKMQTIIGAAHTVSVGMDYWIGAEDRDRDGIFLWPGGTSLSGYTHWHPLELKTYCAYLDHLSDYHWNKALCNHLTMGYICEIGG